MQTVRSATKRQEEAAIGLSQDGVCSALTARVRFYPHGSRQSHLGLEIEPHLDLSAVSTRVHEARTQTIETEGYEQISESVPTPTLAFDHDLAPPLVLFAAALPLTSTSPFTTDRAHTCLEIGCPSGSSHCRNNSNLDAERVLLKTLGKQVVQKHYRMSTFENFNQSSVISAELLNVVGVEEKKAQGVSVSKLPDHDPKLTCQDPRYQTHQSAITRSGDPHDITHPPEFNQAFVFCNAQEVEPQTIVISHMQLLYPTLFFCAGKP
ncbi:hypothetical protein B0H16DRAFT_1688176 [Mycena metata]|uniref:Uncharacterized protein n=1 Tax=Mycena metata TaxID=1033252 RepID=A0AAD7NIW1_9AGAR|nr:hypothetical protein B0H16DRAFT_1688176 [Mycena metata]